MEVRTTGTTTDGQAVRQVIGTAADDDETSGWWSSCDR